MLAWGDGYLEITKTIILTFLLFPKNVSNFSLQESRILISSSKISTDFKK